jgi:hypothetical protein
MYELAQDAGHTQFYSSTAGAPTGCTRLQQLGEPEAASVAAAKGDAGVMMVQSGGMGYSMMPSSTQGMIAEQHRYSGDAMRSDLNPRREFAFSTGGSRKRRSNKKAGKMTGKRRYKKGGSNFGTRRLGRFVRSASRKGFGSVIGQTRRVVRASMKPFSRKYKKSLSSLNRRRHKKHAHHRGSRRQAFFRYRGGQAQSPDNIHYADPSTSIGSQDYATAYQMEASSGCSGVDTKSAGPVCGAASAGPALTGGANNGMRRRNNKRRQNMRGGYAQYMNNTPFSMGYGAGNVTLTAQHSALANPVPFKPYVQ